MYPSSFTTPPNPMILPMRRVLKTWWPLAASWLIMGIEMPAVSAVMARLSAPEINLAAYGGIVFPIALIIEAPIIMLLAASTALSKDWAAYTRMRTFMLLAGAILTTIHMLLAFTPLYYLALIDVIRPPAETVEPARLGLMIMLPWTWSIAYRRFNQGVLIRFGHSGAVGIGTAIRLMVNVLVLGVGYALAIPGIVVGSSAVAAGVLCEAFYTGWRVRPVLNDQLKPAPAAEPLSWRSFARFYTPLALTSLLILLMQPIGSAAISRMPDALNSLAVWPVLSGLVFMIRSLGIAFNEVVVALLDVRRSSETLKRFTLALSAGITLVHLGIAATPISWFWFADLSALTPTLASMARTGFLLALPLPPLTVLQSWFQGSILYGRDTKSIPEAVALSLLVTIAVLGAGIAWGRFSGLFIVMMAMSVSVLVQTLWLALRSREVLHKLRLRDARLSE